MAGNPLLRAIWNSLDKELRAKARELATDLQAEIKKGNIAAALQQFMLEQMQTPPPAGIVDTTATIEPRPKHLPWNCPTRKTAGALDPVGCDDCEEPAR